MSVKRKSFSAKFKAKLVIEILEGEKTVNEIASKPKKLEETFFREYVSSL